MLDVAQRALRGPDSDALRELLISNGVFLACLQLLGTPPPESQRLPLATAVVRTVGTLLLDDDARAAFRHAVGYDRLWTALATAQCSPRTVTALLMEVAVNARLLHHDTPVAPSRLGELTVANPAVLLLLIRLLPTLAESDGSAALWTLEAMCVLAERTYYNRTRCCRAGLVDALVVLLGTWRSATPAASQCLLQLLKVLGGHAMTPDSLAHLLNLMYVQSPTFRPDLYLPLHETLRAAACHQNPSHFLDLHGRRSMLWIPRIERSLAGGYTFHIWIRIESLAAPGGLSPDLVPLAGAGESTAPLGTPMRLRPSRSTNTRQDPRFVSGLGSAAAGEQQHGGRMSRSRSSGASASGALDAFASEDEEEEEGEVEVLDETQRMDVTLDNTVSPVSPRSPLTQPNSPVSPRDGPVDSSSDTVVAVTALDTTAYGSAGSLLSESAASESLASDSPAPRGTTSSPCSQASQDTLMGNSTNSGGGEEAARPAVVGSYEPRLFSFYAPTGSGVEAFFTAGRLAVRTTTRSGRKHAVHTHVFSDSVVPIRRWVALAVVHQPVGSLLSGNRGEVRLFVDGMQQASGSLPLPLGKEPFLDCRIGRGRDVEENVALNRHRLGSTSLRGQVASVQLFLPLQAEQLHAICCLGADHSGAYDRHSLFTHTTAHTLQQMAVPA